MFAFYVCEFDLTYNSNKLKKGTEITFQNRDEITFTKND